MADPSTAEIDPVQQQEWVIPAELRHQLLVALESKTVTLPRMTYEEFLDWADEGTFAEWVDGKVLLMSPASDIHQQIVGFLFQLIDLFVRVRGIGRVYMAPFQMKLQNSGREPDLLFIRTENLSRIQKTFLQGPADLVIEVLSPESIGRDPRG